MTGHARRLGGSSVGLPDILYTERDYGEMTDLIYSIEAKSTGQANLLYIPNDQIIRCFDILKMFSAYDKRFVLFAFKFHGSKTNRRKIKEYHYGIEVNPFAEIDEILTRKIKAAKFIRCSYEGNLTNDLWEILPMIIFRNLKN